MGDKLLKIEDLFLEEFMRSHNRQRIDVIYAVKFPEGH